MQHSLLAEGLRVTELLLEAVTDPARLRAALQAMVAMMDADIGMLATCRRQGDATPGFLLATRNGDPAESSVAAAFPGFALYRRWGPLQTPCRFYGDAELRRIAHEHEPAGSGATPPAADDRAQCMAHVDTGDGGVCYVGFARSASSGAGGFDAERIRTVEKLLPHLRQAYAINRRLESMQAVSAAVMNRFERYHVGVLLVDEDGTLHYGNNAARRILAQEHGLRVNPDGRVAASDPADTDALLSTLRAHIGSDLPDSQFAPGLLKIGRGEGAAPLAIAISPYRGGLEQLLRAGPGGYAVIMVYDPDRPPVQRKEVITQVYDLSSKDSELVCAIAAGDSLEDIARRSQRSLEAVRSQLKRVFRKTGTSRQTELVKLVLSGPAAMVQ